MTHERTMLCTMLLLLTIGLTPATAQLNRSEVDGLANVGIDDRTGQPLPLDTSFTTSDGTAIRLRSVFDGTKPVILSFNYTDCPLLCKLQLSGLVDGLRELDWSAGSDFCIVSVSIDPSETPQQAAIARQQHIQAYGRPDNGNGWYFLTGSPDGIQAATEAAGFEYRYLPAQREFSHAAAAIVCTPDGVISRYLYGVKFEPRDLKLALTEAADGRLGSAVDQLLLFCYRYDEMSGEYTIAAWSLMRLGGILTLAAIGCFIIPVWVRSARRASDPGIEKASRAVLTEAGDGPQTEEVTL